MSEKKIDQEKILEAILNFADAMEAAAVDMKHRIAEIVGIKETSAPTTPKAQAPAPTTQIEKLPQLDPDELEKLLWKTYKTKEAARPGEAGWIFTNTKGAEALADLIEKQGKDTIVQIGTDRYAVKFSGSERQFIGRAPLKKT